MPSPIITTVCPSKGGLILRQHLRKAAVYPHLRRNGAGGAVAVAGRHAFRIHGQDLFLDILTDAGLVLVQKLRFKFTLPVTGNRNLDFAETGPQIFALRAFSSGLRFFRDISFPPSGCF